MKKLLRVVVAACALVWSLASSVQAARAEVPILETNFPGGDFGLFDNPQYVPEPWFMWFVMGELQTPDDVDIVTFDYTAGDRFKAEMFIPAHDELRDFSPNIALVGPGLPVPEQPLPFTLPKGMGAVVATSEASFKYYDIFTQMTFFPRAKIDMVLPQTGRYFVATWGRQVGMSRYALDIGVMENFAPAVIARYPINWYEVRDYLRWGIWPALLALPMIVLGTIVLLRKRTPARLLERMAGASGLYGLAMVFLSINALQVLHSSASIVTVVLVIGSVALALLGTFISIAYLLTPLREKLNLREFARDDNFAWVNGYSIHYSDDGPHTAQPVVLVHGFASSIFTWRDIKTALLSAGYRVIAVDQLGNGASARPAEPIYTTEMQARFVLGVMDQLGVPAAHALGHSFGGRVAMQMAVLAPQRVQRLIVISPEAFATERPKIAQWVKLPLAGYMLAFFSTSPMFVREGLRFVSRQYDWLKQTVVAGYAAPLHVRGSALAQVWQSRSPKDGLKPVPHNLAHIAHHTLILWGAGDPVFPASDGAKLAKIMPKAHLHVLPDTGHVAHEERTEACIRAILAFLSEESPQRHREHREHRD
jgi:pimeloyl-ACP methyl ester carboxylesterase